MQLERPPPLCHNQAILTEAQFALDGSLHGLERITKETYRFCRSHCLRDETEFELNLVLEELFVNAVRHGGCDGREGAAQVHLQLIDDAVRVEFSDQGRPFDPASAPSPDLAAPLVERVHGGLGIHLVRQMVRDLEYRRDGVWNRLTMRLPLIKEPI